MNGKIFLSAIIIISLAFLGFASFKISDLDESKKSLHAELAPQQRLIERIMNASMTDQLPIDRADIPVEIQKSLLEMGIKSVSITFVDQLQNLNDFAAIYTKTERHGKYNYQMITHIDPVGKIKESPYFLYEVGHVFSMPVRPISGTLSPRGTIIIFNPKMFFADQHGLPIYQDQVLSEIDLILKQGQARIVKNGLAK